MRRRAGPKFAVSPDKPFIKRVIYVIVRKSRAKIRIYFEHSGVLRVGRFESTVNCDAKKRVLRYGNE
jgi:hypothetical protein